MYISILHTMYTYVFVHVCISIYHNKQELGFAKLRSTLANDFQDGDIRRWYSGTGVQWWPKPCSRPTHCWKWSIYCHSELCPFSNIYTYHIPLKINNKPIVIVLYANFYRKCPLSAGLKFQHHLLLLLFQVASPLFHPPAESTWTLSLWMAHLTMTIEAARMVI